MKLRMSPFQPKKKITKKFKLKVIIPENTKKRINMQKIERPSMRPKGAKPRPQTIDLHELDLCMSVGVSLVVFSYVRFFLMNEL